MKAICRSRARFAPLRRFIFCKTRPRLTSLEKESLIIFLRPENFCFYFYIFFLYVELFLNTKAFKKWNYVTFFSVAGSLFGIFFFIFNMILLIINFYYDLWIGCIKKLVGLNFTDFSPLFSH